MAAPVIVAAVLVVSGIAKLRDPGGVDRAFVDLKVPAAVSAPWIRRAFPWGEIALGVLLVVVPAPWSVVVAVAAVALMVAYTVLIAGALRRPDEVDCHCFGAAGSSRVTRLTLARNVTFVVLSLLAVVDALGAAPVVAWADASGWGWMPAPVVVRLGASGWGWTLALAVVAWLVYAIVAEGPTASESVETASEDAEAEGEASEEDLEDYVRVPNPKAVLLAADGPTTLAELTRTRPVLLIWVSFSCGSCSAVLAQIMGWRERLPIVDIRPVVSYESMLDSAPEELKPHLLVDLHNTLGSQLEAGMTPSAVLFGADRMVAGGPVAGADAVAQFVDDIAHELEGFPG